MEGPQRTAKFRTIGGRLGRLHTVLLFSLTGVGALWSLEIHNLFEWQIFKTQVLGLVFVIALIAVFTGVRATKSESGTHIPWYDWVLSAASLVVGGYIVVRYPDIVSISARWPSTAGRWAAWPSSWSSRRRGGWSASRWSC